MNNMVCIWLPHSYNYYKIESDNFEFIDYITLYYGSLSCGCLYPRLNCIVSVLKYYDGKFSIMDNDSKCIFEKKSCFEDAILLVIDYIRNNTKMENDWAILHGSAVQVGSKNFLLLGESGSGKTTLTAYLGCQKLVQVLSEDIILINVHTAEFVPICRPLFLRKGGYYILKNTYGIDVSTATRLGSTNDERYIWRYALPNVCEKVFIDKALILARDKQNKQFYNGFEMYLYNFYQCLDPVQCIQKSLVLFKNLSVIYFNNSDLYESYCRLVSGDLYEKE